MAGVAGDPEMNIMASTGCYLPKSGEKTERKSRANLAQVK